MYLYLESDVFSFEDRFRHIHQIKFVVYYILREDFTEYFMSILETSCSIFVTTNTILLFKSSFHYNNIPIEKEVLLLFLLHIAFNSDISYR